MRAVRDVSWRMVAVALATVIVAGFAARDALAFATQSVSPELALSIDPGNPVALARRAEAQLAAGDPGMDGAKIGRIAKQSIRSLALNAPAFRLYGLVQTGNGDMGRLGEQMAMANHLSRRDLGTQLFMIEDSVRRNDVAGALAAYDDALRIARSSRSILYPVLTEAMQEPLIRQRFVRYIQARPPWLESFLRYAITNSENPASIAELALTAKGFPTGTAYSSLNTELLSVLVEKDEYQMAIRYYRSLKSADPAVLTSLAISKASTDAAFAPVTWQPYSLTGIDAAWVAADKDSVDLEATLEAGYTGPVARKVLALAPGSYELTAPFRSDANGADQTLSWKISCPAGAVLLDVSAQLAEKGALAGRFSVPADCPAQIVLISTRTVPGLGSIDLVLSSPRLSRIG
jgi:hypothetical protein